MTKTMKETEKGRNRDSSLVSRSMIVVKALIVRISLSDDKSHFVFIAINNPTALQSDT